MRKNIMIVDDDADILKMVCMLLDMNGFTAIPARSGIECLSLLHTGTIPDAILLDIMMPEKDGYSICREIKSNYRFASVAVIMLTARQQNRDKVDAYKSGADGYIQKPFDNDTLIKELNACMAVKGKT
jgi:DNA-binding response OmpR family regulator